MDILNILDYPYKDLDFAVENGKYNFFTFANDISKCNEYEGLMNGQVTFKS